MKTLIIGKPEILQLIESGELLIDPLSEMSLTEDGIDLRLGKEIARLQNASIIFDTHKEKSVRKFYKKEVASSFVIKESERLLLCTFEKIALPRSVVGFLGLRSTYARIGLQAPYGFINSGFQGQLTVEVVGGSFPIRLYAMDRLFHIALFEKTTPSTKSYEGKYQNQVGVTLPLFGSSEMSTYKSSST